MSLTYYIREFATVSSSDVQAPRTLETLRRSLEGTLCVLAYELGTEPIGWLDGMDQEQCAAQLTSPSSAGIWYVPELD